MSASATLRHSAAHRGMRSQERAERPISSIAASRSIAPSASGLQTHRIWRAYLKTPRNALLGLPLHDQDSA